MLAAPCTCSANDSVSTYDVVSMKKLSSEENNVQSASLDSHGDRNVITGLDMC